MLSILKKHKKMDELNKCFDLLIDLKDPVKIINYSGAGDLFITCYEYIYDRKLQFIKLTINKNIHEILANLFCYIESIKNDINFDEFKSFSLINFQNQTLSQRCLLILIILDKIFNIYFLISIELRRFFVKINQTYNKTYLSSFISFINDSEFIANFMRIYADFDGFINTIQNLSVSADECKNVWQELDAVDILLKFASNNKKFSIEAHAVIAYIASDEDLERITIISEIISNFANLAVKCINNNKKNNCELEFKDVDGENKIFSVMTIPLNNGFELSIDVLLLSLFYFAINEKLKLDIYNKIYFKNSLNKIIFTGKDVEKHFAIQLLSQLAFNKQVREDIKSNIELINHIESLKTQNLTFIRLKQSCENFLWIINDENNIDKKKELDKSTANKHIMISYNSASRQTCLKIKQELENHNYDVWIDVEDIYGSSLDSMAKAVEQSSCVLMCVTEKYRQSVNCKSEAEYANRLGKNIIPVIMQKGYEKVTGWLGIIIGAKIFVDFSKHDFESAIKLLIKQIKLLNDDKTLKNISQSEKSKVEINISNNNDNNNHSISIGKIEKDNNDEPRTWDVKKVKECLQSKNLENIHLVLSDQIDGSLLYQLYEMKKHTPEFYYKSLTKNDVLDMKMVLELNNLLSNLFEKIN